MEEKDTQQNALHQEQCNPNITILLSGSQAGIRNDLKNQPLFPLYIYYEFMR